MDPGELLEMMAKMLRGLRARARGREAPLDATPGGDAGRRTWVLHPFLIAAFPIVSLYAHNVYETSPRAMALPLAVTLSATFLAWMALRQASGDAGRSGLAVSMMVAGFFGFRAIRDVADVVWPWLLQHWVYAQYSVSPLVLMGFMGLIFVAAFRRIFRRSGRPERWTRPLNGFALILVGLPAINAASARLSEPASKKPDAALPVVSASKRGWTPDIYFIVLDGYARTDVMKDLFDLDNEPLLRKLERLGFFVARKSTSNYCQTRLSLASTLNANYLDKLMDLSSPDLLPVTDLIRDNLVRKTLRPLGYKFVSFQTGFEPTDFPDSDVYLMPRPGNPAFSQLLLEMTPLDAWLSQVHLEDRYSALRDRTLFLLDRLPAVAGIKGPTFTFAHVISPHPPFVFGPNGEDVSPRREVHDGRVGRVVARAFGTPEYFRDGYRDQSAYLTARVGRVIEQILAASPEPPVIILQSDHGSWLRYHPDDAEATDLRERFGILNCVYAPGRKVAGLNDTMTSVNTFRAVLAEILGADLPPLPERNYFSPFHDPLVFTDITERLHSPAEAKRTFTYPETYLGIEQHF